MRPEAMVHYSVNISWADRQRLEMIELWGPKLADLTRRCIHTGIVEFWHLVPDYDQNATDEKVSKRLLPAEYWERVIECLLVMENFAKSYGLGEEPWLEEMRRAALARIGLYPQGPPAAVTEEPSLAYTP